MERILKRICFKNVIFMISICLFVYLNYLIMSTSNEQKDISSKVLRLHILANSDSVEDQSLKLKVRDSIVQFMTNEISSQNIKNKQELIKYVGSNSYKLENIANNTITDNGFTYTAKVSIGDVSFPTKYYSNVSMPAGDYDAVQIKIGSAKGQNWWCVLFPPLCITPTTSNIEDITVSNDILKKQLTEDEYSLLTKKNKNITFKFKILEQLAKLKEHSKKK